MKVRYFLLVAVALVMLTGCYRDASALLERAEAYLPSQPDSAEVCLDSIGQPQRLNDAQKAWYGLLRTYVDNRQGKGVESDSLIRDSYEYYREASHAGQTSDMTLLRRYAQSCYYMALFYESCDSTKQREDMLYQAIKGSEECEDWHTCYLAYTQLGNSTLWGNPDYAIQQSKKALDIYHKINDDVNNEVLILGHIAGCSESLDSALKYYMKGYELAEKNKLLKSQNAMSMGLAKVYSYKGEADKALSFAKRGIVTANGEVLATSLLTLAQCYYACDSLSQARDVLNSIPCDSDYITQYLVLRDLSDIAFRQHNYDSIYTYVDSAYECLEDRFFHIQSVKDEYYQANLIKELEKEQIQHESERNMWVLSIIIIILLMLSLLIYIRVRTKKQFEVRLLKQRLQRLSEHYLHTKEELNMIETDLSTLKRQKEEELAALQLQLEEVQRNYDLNMDNYDELAKSQPVVSIKRKLDVTALVQPLTEQEWQTLIDEFRHDMPQLYAIVTDHHLSTLEFRVTILTRLAIRPDDMALLLNLSKQSISNTKSNANKKLFSDNSARSFPYNLSHI